MTANIRPPSIGYPGFQTDFLPFSSSIATSLASYLPLGAPAQVLSLGVCDFRKFLYTLYSERNDGSHPVNENSLTGRAEEEV
jgi:hypothetical protein